MTLYGKTVLKLVEVLFIVHYLILCEKDKGNLSHGNSSLVLNSPFSEPERTVIPVEPAGKITCSTIHWLPSYTVALHPGTDVPKELLEDNRNGSNWLDI